MTRGYWPDGYLATVTDPLNQVTTFTPDLVGRVEEVLRSDGETVLYDHDDVGNLIAVMPPGQAAHILGYSGVDQRSSYDPPALSTGTTLTSWDHDIDRSRAAGVSRSPQNGRLEGLTVGGVVETLTLETIEGETHT